MRQYQFSSSARGWFENLFKSHENSTSTCGRLCDHLIDALSGSGHGSPWLSVYDDGQLVFHAEISDTLRKCAQDYHDYSIRADSAAFRKCETMGWSAGDPRHRDKVEKHLQKYIAPIIQETINEHKRKAGLARPARGNGKPVQATGQPVTEGKG